MFQFWMNVGHTTEHYHSKYKSLHLWAFVAFLQKILQIGIWLYHLFTYLLTYLYLHTDLAMMTGLRTYLPTYLGWQAITDLELSQSKSKIFTILCRGGGVE